MEAGMEVGSGGWKLDPASMTVSGIHTCLPAGRPASLPKTQPLTSSEERFALFSLAA
jgi:hypothetical protein